MIPGINNNKKDVTSEISMLDLHDSVNKLTMMMEHHIQRMEEKDKLLLSKLEENKKHTDRVQEHFDMRILECRDEVKTVLNNNYYTQKETEDRITEAINVRLKNFLIKLALYATLFVGSAIGAIWVFLSKNGHVILSLLQGKN